MDNFDVAFREYFPGMVENLSKSTSSTGSILWSFHRIRDVLAYNVPHGKQTRGITLVSSFHCLKDNNVTVEERNLSLALGWAVEILQGSFLVADDVMDQSETRRGRSCWYRLPEVGYQAVNDSLILESCVFLILRRFCRHLPCYIALVELFQEVIFNTEMGQSLDMMTSEQPVVDFSLFTDDRYFSIVRYKTAYYSFYLPVAVAMHLSGISDDECHAKVQHLLLQMGNLFQVQDDYLDCFGDPAITGKVGTDIEDNKCTWLIIRAIEVANQEQLKALQENYGKKDPGKVLVVKQLYEELNLKGIFEKYENEQYEEICDAIKHSDVSGVPKTIFLTLLDKIYRRKK